jgi:hypothetical protein
VGGMSNGPTSSGNARRRNATLALTQLPAAGYIGPTPSWPLGPDVSLRSQLQVAQARLDELEFSRDEGKPVDEDKIDRVRATVLELQHVLTHQAEAEAELWSLLWETPQAVQWARLRWTRTVATYVRWQVRGEAGDLKAAVEARHLNDRLGLNPVAMQRLRWTVAVDELAEKRDERAAATGTDPAPAPTRKRRTTVKAVDPDAAG